MLESKKIFFDMSKDKIETVASWVDSQKALVTCPGKTLLLIKEALKEAGNTFVIREGGHYTKWEYMVYAAYKMASEGADLSESIENARKYGLLEVIGNGEGGFAFF